MNTAMRDSSCDFESVDAVDYNRCYSREGYAVKALAIQQKGDLQISAHVLTRKECNKVTTVYRLQDLI